MAHKHDVKDTDTSFLINPITRAFKNESSSKTIVIQHDHNSERFSFSLPRYVEDHDMSLCNVVQVHYINIDRATKEEFKGVYEVEDLHVDGDNVIFSWLISGNATQYAGSLSFIISFKCVVDSIVEYRWNTAICNSISVSSSIDNGEDIAYEYADILEQWKKDLVESGGMIVDTALNEESNYPIANSAVAKEFSKLKEDVANNGKGLTEAQINALDGMFKVVAYIKEDVSTEYNAFKVAFGLTESGGDNGEDTPTEPSEPTTPTVTLTSITATYNGGSVLVGSELTDLASNIVVTAKYSDGTSKQVTGYELSGTINEGSNTITVSYQGKTTTFTVVGYVEQEEPSEPTEAVYTFTTPTTFNADQCIDTGYTLLDKEKSWSLCMACTDGVVTGDVFDASPNGSNGLALTNRGAYFRTLMLGGSLYKDINGGATKYKLVVTHTKNTDYINYHFVKGTDETLDSGEITYTKYLTDTNIINPYPKTLKLGGEHDGTPSYKGIIHKFEVYERVLSETEITEFINTTNYDMPEEPDTPSGPIEAVYKLAEETTLDGTSGIDTGYVLNDVDKDFSILTEYTQTGGGVLFDASKNGNLFGPYFTFTGNYFMVGTRVQVTELYSKQVTKAILTHENGSGIFKWYILNDTTNNAIYEYEHTYENYASNSHTIGNTITMKLGSKYTGDANYFKGTIHQFEIYERVLSEDEINTFMGV